MFDIRLDESLFVDNSRDFSDIGLFSYSRDALHQREIQIINKMIENRIIEIRSYYLCDCNNDYKKKLNYSRGIYELDDSYIDKIPNIYRFIDYRNERPYNVFDKFSAFNYLCEEYDTLFDEKDSSLYVKDLNLNVMSEVQTISQFIYGCLDKNRGTAVIARYQDKGIYKIAIRLVIVKEEFNEVYNMNTLSYTKYVNNFNDVVDRYMMADSCMDYIIVDREAPSKEDAKDVKSCTTCINYITPLKKNKSYSYFKWDRFRKCTLNDKCSKDKSCFNMYSNNIDCESFEEEQERCYNCFKENISYTEYHLKGKRYCSNECEKKYIERKKKREEEYKKLEELRKSMSEMELLEYLGF